MTVYVPVLVVLNETWIALVWPRAKVKEVGITLTVGPVGELETVKVTVPLKPFWLARTTVGVVVDPALVVSDCVVGLMEKS